MRASLEVCAESSPAHTLVSPPPSADDGIQAMMYSLYWTVIYNSHSYHVSSSINIRKLDHFLYIVHVVLLLSKIRNKALDVKILFTRFELQTAGIKHLVILLYSLQAMNEVSLNLLNLSKLVWDLELIDLV